MDTATAVRPEESGMQVPGYPPHPRGYTGKMNTRNVWLEKTRGLYLGGKELRRQSSPLERLTHSLTYSESQEN